MNKRYEISWTILVSALFLFSVTPIWAVVAMSLKLFGYWSLSWWWVFLPFPATTVAMVLAFSWYLSRTNDDDFDIP